MKNIIKKTKRRIVGAFQDMQTLSKMKMKLKPLYIYLMKLLVEDIFAFRAQIYLYKHKMQNIYVDLLQVTA